MTADLLRRAAKLMRERAGATREPGPDAAQWYGSDGDDGDIDALTGALDAWFNTSAPRADAEHIASWHPAVALAVTDWLDRVATALETGDAEDVLGLGEPSDARTVALAYLGETP